MTIPCYYYSHAAVQDLVRRMLTVDFRQRITIEEVMNHPWMTQSGVTSDVDLTDAVNSLSEFNARRKLRASAWAVAWSRRITALRAAKLRPYVQSFSRKLASALCSTRLA